MEQLYATLRLLAATNEDLVDAAAGLDGSRDRQGIVRLDEDPAEFRAAIAETVPQRLQLDSDGNVWFSERQGNKMGRLDPKTGTFKEFPLPGPEASPYAVGIDRDGMIWYSSHEQDTIGRFDPKSGDVVEYPYPHPEISMREFDLDRKGRMWYASSANNKIGYFTYNDPEKK